LGVGKPRSELAMKTSGHTVLITGGGTGIGLAIAEELSLQGNTVIICGRRKAPLVAARNRLPNLHYRVCDLSKPKARLALAKWASSQFKDLGLLVNNAGIQRAVDFLKGGRDLAAAEEEIATNLVAPIHLSALLIPRLRRQPEAAIVNISSGLAFTPLSIVPVYCATKAAIHSLSLTMRFQLRETPIRVFEIAPPIVHTGLSGQRRRPEDGEHSMSASDVAKGVIRALRNDKYEVALGPAADLHKRREALFAAINN
jgi:uncharacterized oxidoreductase